MHFEITAITLNRGEIIRELTYWIFLPNTSVPLPNNSEALQRQSFLTHTSQKFGALVKKVETDRADPKR